MERSEGLRKIDSFLECWVASIYLQSTHHEDTDLTGINHPMCIVHEWNTRFHMKSLFFISRNYIGGGKTKILRRIGQRSQQDNQRWILKRFVYNIYIYMCSKNTSNLPSEIWPCVQVSFQLWVKIGLEFGTAKFVLEPSCMRRCSLSTAQLRHSSKKYQHQRMLDMTSFHR